MTSRQNAPGYEEDFVAWLEDQAQHLRHGDVEALDRENVAEELEGMARSDRRESATGWTVLLVHLLKYRFQPRRRSSSWRATIGEQRSRIATVIDDSSSLQSFPSSVLDQCYAEARARTVLETQLPEGVFPAGCPYGIEDVLDPRWLPCDPPR